jgi:hypothetical protein
MEDVNDPPFNQRQEQFVLRCGESDTGSYVNAENDQ